MKYHIKFSFTSDRQEDLKEGIWTESVGKRMIKAEFGLDPCTVNSNGDLRYETTDGDTAMKLMEIAFTTSKGGWWSIGEMEGVYHIRESYKGT